MRKFKSRLIKKEKLIVAEMVQTFNDYYGDFYITKNNLRLYIKENISLLFEGLKKGDKIVYNNNNLVIVTGFSDKYTRKYIKFLVKDYNRTEDFLSKLSWNLNCDIWAKLKKNNPLVNILQKNNFKWFADRGRECLLYRKGE